jgi:sec-independent protein translocase protein TatB
MFDIGWSEMFVIALVALIVVGPKDLPRVLRSGARVLNKARSMSREFQMGLAELAREAELDEIKRKVEQAARFDPADELRKSVDPTGKLSAEFDPAEFNRKLKESVEAGPPRPPAAPAAPPASEAVPGSAAAPDPASAAVADSPAPPAASDVPPPHASGALP